MTTEPAADDGVCVRESRGAAPASTVLVSFAGHGGGYGGIATFEFAKTIEDLPCDKIYIRDPSTNWYLRGVPGVGDGPVAVAAWLRERCGARRVVAIGNSAGGWGALLVGVLMGADEVHAFVPKTRLTLPEDFRDQEKFGQVPDDAGIDPVHRDLKELLARRADGPTRVHIHYPKYEPIDSKHALRLAGVRNVRLFEYRFMYHGLVREIRRHGLLRPLLANAIAGNRLGVSLTALRARLLLRDRTTKDALVRPLWRLVTTKI